MSRSMKSPAVREAEKRVARRVDDVIAAARAVRVARRDTLGADTRRLARDLDFAVDDLEAAERRLDEETGKVLAYVGEVPVENAERDSEPVP